MMKNLNKKFVLYSNCIPVKGFSKSIICDLQNGTYKNIPNSLYEILINYKSISIQEIITKYDSEDEKQIIQNYFKFLLENDFGFLSDTPENFPEMNKYWDHPSIITNSIIDFGKNFDKIDYKKAIKELSILGCKAIEFRAYEIIPKKFLIELINLNEENRIRDFRLILKFKEYNEDFFAELYERNPCISFIGIHSAPDDKIIKINNNELFKISFTKKELTNESHCGIINENTFIINTDFFMESLFYNNCLNRKISIDQYGFIKNCPSLKENFGHININSLSSVLKNKDFTKTWNLAKSKIEECKLCEFRLICSDCRVNEVGEITTKKPIKCNYDPINGVKTIL